MAVVRAMPVKTREVQHALMDSTIWNDFRYRAGDIVIGSWSKSGTVWVQQIIGQLLFDGVPDVPVAEMSVWVDMVFPPREAKLQHLEAQTHRRFLKTHLPADALVFSPEAKYIYVARDGRDVVWSLFNHHSSYTDEFYEMVNSRPDRVGPPLHRPPDSVRQFFHEWLDGDGYPYWSFWESVRSWWAVRDLPNVRLQHFAALKADMESEIRGIAGFLGIPIKGERWPDIVRHCSFDYMRNHAAGAIPLGGSIWKGGQKAFIYKGVNGRWRDVLTESEVDKYERIAREQLGEDCAQWLADGRGE